MEEDNGPELRSPKAGRGRSRTQCKHCNESFSTNSTSYKRHIETHFQEGSLRFEAPWSPKKRKIAEHDPVEPTVQEWDTARQKKANILLANLIYNHCLPFALVDAPEFIEFVSYLSDGQFKPTTRQTLAVPTLEKIYQNTKAEVEAKLIAEKVVTLGCDGSSDGCQDPITHIIAITSDYTPFLLQEVLHNEEAHTSDLILEEIDGVVSSLSKIGVKVRGIISYNEQKMLSVRQQFAADATEILDQVVSCPGDPPHALQLVVKDIKSLPDFEKICADSNFLQNKIKNTRCKQFLKNQLGLDDDGRLGVAMGCITRWSSDLVQFQKQWKSDLQLLMRRDSYICLYGHDIYCDLCALLGKPPTSRRNYPAYSMCYY
eukprot:TRINITY_DN381_c0_g1_i18.p1 TRINITY_DN381_c0_g1~~TRINITY_DN381_c0_g1_i18.p1  ORF type:complete len:373 (-),score=46.18 TRINITY_DN381_c0_g1_i18:722-1840(-)